MKIHCKCAVCQVQTANRIAGLREDIDSAFLALGGRTFQKNDCRCDASGGQVPCEYCAIFSALTRCDRFLEDQVKRQKYAEEPLQTLASWGKVK